jgi:hypothetical protein
VDVAVVFGDEALPERFWVKVEEDEETGCWKWTASSRSASGRGQFNLNGTMTTAPRLAYRTFVAPIPRKFQVRTRCGVGRCTNPAHLVLVATSEALRERTLKREWAEEERRLLKKEFRLQQIRRIHRETTAPC